MKRKKRGLFLGVILAITVGCQPLAPISEPTVLSPLPLQRLQRLPSAFPPLSPQEVEEDWGKELIIGEAFAQESDFYRAITCYKRAAILLPEGEKYQQRRLQLDYDIVSSYYLGGKYAEALVVFESSPLSQVNPSFPSFNALLLMLYECYLATGQEEKGACVLEVIQKCSSDSATDLRLYRALKQGELEEVRELLTAHPQGEEMREEFVDYERVALSPNRARLFNAMLPGAGYYYVGQRRTALTSFLLNSLFTAAAYHFFHRGDIAAGVITTSLEMGWYLGGINGAGLAAQEFNTRLYEGVARNMLMRHEAFPLLMWETCF